MEILLRLAHVRALLNQFRRKAQRKFLRQLQVGKFKLPGEVLLWEPACQDRQRVTLLRQLLQQGRQSGDELRELRFLGGYVELAGIPL